MSGMSMNTDGGMTLALKHGFKAVVQWCTGALL